MVRKIMTKIMTIIVILLFSILLGACGSKEEFVSTYQIYYVNNEETTIRYNEYGTDATEPKVVVEELLNQLGTVPDKLEYKAPLATGFKLLSYTITEGNIVLSFDDKYKDLPVTTEVLIRAALVRTLTQVKGINYVSILIRSEPLMDSLGNIVGVMTPDMFVENAGKEFSTYEQAKLRLFFSNKEGNGLVAVNRTVYYNSNISLEKLVMEQLIAGPKEEKVYPTINPVTKIVGVTVKDGICYVNLDEAFLTQPYAISANVTIYSIANSLVELPNINKVQISINGNTNVTYKKSTNLSTIFERNLDMVKQ